MEDPQTRVVFQHAYGVYSIMSFVLNLLFLNHLSQVDSSTLTLWNDPFPTEGLSGWLVFIITIFF